MRLLNLTEAGKRLGMSRTTVKKRIDAGSITALVDPDTGWLRVSEDEVEAYRSRFVVYIPPQESQPSQPSHVQA
jgi:predicted site-specific integrase-resolvase